MREILDLSFSAPNIIPTFLLLVTILYWILVLVGFLDLSTGDFDLDKDVSLDKEVSLDKDLDLHHEGHIDHDAHHEAHTDSAWVSALKFFNFGEVPFMAMFSFISFFGWAGSLTLNYYIHNASFWISLALLIPVLLVAAILTKFVTWPLKGFFRSLNDIEKPFDFTGRICTIEVGTFGDKVGQAEVLAENKVILLSVKSHDGSRFSAGQKAVILNEAEEGSAIYYIGPFTEGNP